MIMKSFLSKICSLRNITLMAFFPLISLFSSCVTQRNIEYLKDRKGGATTFTEPVLSEYKLKPHDELLIQINSLDEEAANVFSNSTNRQFLNYSYIDPYGDSLLAYPVDKEGYLILPVIGSVMVKDKTRFNGNICKSPYFCQRVSPENTVLFHLQKYQFNIFIQEYSFFPQIPARGQK